MKKLSVLMAFTLLGLLQTPVLAQTNSPNTQSQTTPLTPDISKQLKLTPLEGTKQIQLNLVNCGGWLGLDCGLAHVLLPASAYIDSRELQFDNSTPIPTKVVNTTVIAQGAITGYQLKNSAISVSETSQSLPANQIVNLHLLVKRSAIPPDKYQGSVYLFLDSQGNRLTLPINLNVRSGPFIPLLVLFFGVILGRLFKYLQEGGEAQADTLIEVQRLRQDILDSNLNPEDQEILYELSAEVLKFVYRQNLEEAKPKIDAIRKSHQLLASLEEIEEEVDTSEDQDNYETQKNDIRKVRNLVKNQENDAAQKKIDELKNNLSYTPNLPFGLPTEEETPQTDSINDMIQKNNRIQKVTKFDKSLTHLSEFFQKQLPEFIRVVFGLSDAVRVEAIVLVIRPLLSSTLLVGLSIGGLNSLYVENGESFGARAFADYLGLILWGLSADVASRGLSGLQGSKK